MASQLYAALMASLYAVTSDHAIDLLGDLARPLAQVVDAESGTLATLKRS